MSIYSMNTVDMVDTLVALAAELQPDNHGGLLAIATAKAFGASAPGEQDRVVRLFAETLQVWAAITAGDMKKALFLADQVGLTAHQLN